MAHTFATKPVSVVGGMTVSSIGVMLKLVVDRIMSDDGESHTLLSLPEHVLEVRKLCAMANSDVYDVEQVVVRDPAFCGYLLQLANSPLYAAGKQECSKLVDAVRRLGVHAVGETALVFALRQMHQIRGISNVLTDELKHNWQAGWDLGRRATELYWQHRHRGSRDVRRIDVSDVVTAGILTRMGHLAVLTGAAVLERKGKRLTHEQLGDVADQLNPLVLPQLLEYWRVGAPYAAHLLSPPGSNEPLHHTDYLWAARVLELLGSSRHMSMLEKKWHPVCARLMKLEVLDEEITSDVG